jgi:hypothetical protein
LGDNFSTIAEVGVALAGFSGLLFAFKRHSGSFDSQAERFGVFYLLGASLSATVLALLPGVLGPVGTPGVTWVALPLLSGSVLVGLEVLLIRSIRRGGKPRLPWVRRVFVLPNWAVIVLQFAGVVGLVKPEAAYGIGLWWLVVHAATQFFVHVGASLRSHAP